jgi:hypothetical protein
VISTRASVLPFILYFKELTMDSEATTVLKRAKSITNIKPSVSY